MDDSTSSSAANSTRRASSLANSNNHTSTEPAEAIADEEDPDASFSPIRPGDLQEQPHELSSSPFSGSSLGGSEGLPSPMKDVEDADTDSEDFDAESTAMSLDNITGRTQATGHADDDTSSSERLNEALRQASKEAGKAGILIDEDGDVSMEIADQEITGAFKPWIQKGQRISFDMEDMSALQDQENIDPYRNSRGPRHAGNNDDIEDDYNENEDLSMEITSAVGQILSNSHKQQSHRASLGEQTNYGEQTMELTKVVGGIQEQQSSPAKSDLDSNFEENEEMTMEFTSVVGGVLSKHIPGLSQSHDGMATATARESVGRDFSEWGSGDEEEDAGMDMEFTGAVGGILSPIMEERTGSQVDETVGMDITTAVGRILPPTLTPSNKTQAKYLMELESDSGQLASSPFQVQVSASPPKPLKSPYTAPTASETGSPSLASAHSRRSKRGTVSPGIRLSPTRRTTPNKDKPRTPSKQATPQPPRPTTPGKTPPSSNISFRSASPRKLFREEIKATAAKSRSPLRRNLFDTSATSDSTPAFILRPNSRQISGLGIDKEGLGSPKVTEILDRRRSIGEDAQEFVPREPSPRRLRFEDPVKLHEEVDREREEDELKEARLSSTFDTSSLDPKLNLRDLISSLTPKKRKVGSRKSLHVGAARGLLGKRPAELDDEEEDDSPKRIRAANASPVKPIKLPAPPSKDETVRRIPRTGMGNQFSPGKQVTLTPRSLRSSQRVESPLKLASPIKTPRDSNEEPVQEQGGEEKDLDDGELDYVEDDPEWEPMHLQDFLNLTNIHFMELTTTKRRHTTVASNERSNDLNGSRLTKKKFVSLEDCVAAGFCTVPMLELYQHVSRNYSAEDSIKERPTNVKLFSPVAN